MKILLINPPVREWAKPNVFPLGLGYIASVLLADKHEIKVLDINAQRLSKDQVENEIRISQYDVVGIGGIVTTYRYVKWLAEVLKKHHPDKPLVIGGSVGSSIPQIILEKNPVDYVCIGEGEETVVDLVRAIQNNDDIPGVKGIWYKDDNGKIHKNVPRSPIKNLDKILLPAWDLFPMEIYLKNPIGAPNRNKWIDGFDSDSVQLTMNLYATRGCPYNCIYCYHDFMGHGYRYRSPKSIIEEMQLLYQKYGVLYFHFIDDEFVVNKKFVFEFCKLIMEFSKKIEHKITWGCTGRVNLMTEELIKAMCDAGCVLIGYGIESGSQKMLDFIDKRVTVEEAKNAIRLTIKHIGWADCSFMIGYPGESKETIQETIDLCKELALTPEVIFFLTPYPGTELYKIALERGKIKDEEKYILELGEQGEKIRVNFTDLSDEELYNIQTEMIKGLKAWNRIKHAA